MPIKFPRQIIVNIRWLVSPLEEISSRVPVRR